jgi:hypothetical protein
MDSQASYWLAIMLWIAVARGTFPQLRNTWEKQEMLAAAEWMTDEGASEEEVEQVEEAAEEEFFF